MYLKASSLHKLIKYNNKHLMTKKAERVSRKSVHEKDCQNKK